MARKIIGRLALGWTRKLIIGSAACGWALVDASLVLAAPAMPGGQAYVNQCAQAGVPTPPPWNYEDAWHGRPNSLWKRSGVVDVRGPGLPFTQPTMAGSSGQIAEAFYYPSTSPVGVCIALPRSVFPPMKGPDDGPPSYIDLLGVICQGKVSGKACFWDHGAQYVSGGVDPLDTLQFGDGPPATHFVGGAELELPGGVAPGGVCTDCHRGQNAFIIHPASKLGLTIPNLMADSWYEPLVPANWPMNPGPTSLFAAGLTGSCLTCHNGGPGGRFPSVSSATGNYCGILRNTFATTMPYPNVTGMEKPAEHPPYQLLDTACNAAPAPEDNAAQKMMSFEGPAAESWATQFGTVSSVTTNVTEGTTSMSVNASGYVRVDSSPFSTWQLPVVGTALELDIYVPAGQPNPYWLGAVQLYVTIPGAQIINTFIGQLELTPAGTGWRTGSFGLPPQVVAALNAQQSSVRFGIAVNVPNGAPPLLLDNLKFSGSLSLPAPPPSTAVQYDFERGGTWEGRDGAVFTTTNSSLFAFTGSSSMKVELDGASDGRVWTTPAVSPGAGATVSYRIYIPTGTQVSAIQPYVMDGNWAWSDSWHTNLPRDGWLTLTTTVPANAKLPLNEMGLKIYLSQPNTGPIYLDSIQW